MKASRDTHTLVEFHQKSPEFVEKLKATGEPLILTIDGKAELVVQSAGSYQKLLDIAEEARLLERIRISLAEAEMGLGQPVGEAFEQISRELNLPSD